jgi:nitrate/nitrite transporter NarK
MKFSKGFWVLSLLTALVFATFTPFSSNLALLINTRFGFSLTETGRLMVMIMKCNRINRLFLLF